MTKKTVHCYLHFETKPAYDELHAFFSHFPAYRRVFATSYSFSVPYDQRLDVPDLVQQCFPHSAYALSCGTFTHRDEPGLFIPPWTPSGE